MEATNDINIFYCYAREDKNLCNELDMHLKPLGRQFSVRIWYDGEISPGAEWEKEIYKHLNEAHIILLLVSPAFMASDYAYSKEMTRAMQRHDAGEAYVLPIIMRYTDWEETPIGKLQVLPMGAKPLKSWSDRDKAFKDIVGGIRKVIKEIIARHAGASQVMEAQESPSPVASSLIPPSQLPQPVNLITSLNQSQQSVQLAPTLSQPSIPTELARPAQLAASKDQRKRILQILYEKRSDPLQTLDREDLARLMAKQWVDIQPDVAYLEEKGYIITKHNQIRARVFHRLNITAEGIDFFESGTHPSLRRIEVFISSPSDVYEERQIAKRVIERCNRIHSIAERYVLRPLAYEESAPAEVGNRPQTVVDRHMMKAGSSDLFICILWHRMGTPVTHEETGERFQAGTEYEFLDAYRNNQKHGRPYILLYRGMKAFPLETNPEQLRAVEAFFKQFEGEHAEVKGLYKTYHSNEDFEDKLFHDIDTVLSKNLIL